MSATSPCGRKRETEIWRLGSQLISLWLDHPEMRLGQLLSNAVPAGAGPDLFYLEDAQLVKLLEKYSQNIKKEPRT